MLMCYQTSITYRTADGSCQGGDLRHGILALVDGQWEYEKYVQIDFDTWAETGAVISPWKFGGAA